MTTQQMNRENWNSQCDKPCMVERDGRRVRVTVEQLTAEELRTVFFDTLMLHDMAPKVGPSVGLDADGFKARFRCHAEFVEMMAEATVARWRGPTSGSDRFHLRKPR